MKEKNKDKTIKILLPALFTIVGGFLGFLYSYKIGCVTGTCAIMSNPFAFAVYCSILGFLFGSIFVPSRNSKPEDVDVKD